MTDQTFEEWLSALRDYHNSIGAPYGTDFIEVCGIGSWRPFFDDSCSPQEVIEDIDSYD